MRKFFLPLFAALALALAGTVVADDDFFAPESAAPEVVESLAAASESASKTAESVQESAPPAAETEAVPPSVPASDTSAAADAVPLDRLIPSDALLIFRTVRLARLNEKLRYLFERAGWGKLAPSDWLKLASFGKGVDAVDFNRSAAIVYLPLPSPDVLASAVFLPVNDFAAFAAALGADSVPAEGAPVELKKVPGWSAFSLKGYAVLYESQHGDFPVRIASSEPFPVDRYTPSGLKQPDFTLETTERGVRVFANLAHKAANDFLPLVRKALAGMDVLEGDAGGPFDISSRTDEILRRIGTNLRSARFDGMIGRDGLVSATVLRPYPETPLARQIDDKGGPSIPTSLDGPDFLKIVPDRRAPLAGQVDLSPESAANLEQPFDRIRHIEYSFALPQEGELLAESWCFFLEVDDSEAFVNELIVPKAQLIGGHIGSEKLGELGAKILGNLATRRQARGYRPLLGSPEEAAAIGEELGANLGGSIGASVGEQEAMKIYDFDGQKLLISDLALYTQKMKEIRARERGERTRPPILLDGEPTLRLLIGNILSGLESGSLEGIIRDHFGVAANSSDGDLLLARRNLILVLDPAHLLIVPGNESALRAGLRRWRAYQDGASANETDETNDYGRWRKSWDDLCLEMNAPEAQILRSANRFDLNAARVKADFARQYYVPNLPVLFPKPLPANLPGALAVSTTGPETALFYSVVPNEIVAALVDQFLKKK